MEVRLYSQADEPFACLELLGAFDQALEQALDIYTVLQPTVAEGPKTEAQHAAIALFPTGLSIAYSIRELLRQAFVGPARILVRPLFERTAALDYVVNNPEGGPVWARGWRSGDRPSLPKLMAAMSNEDDRFDAIVNLVNDYNALVHVSREDSRQFLAEDPAGQLGYSPTQTPREIASAENVSAAGTMAVTFLASNAKRAFRTR